MSNRLKVNGGSVEQIQGQIVFHIDAESKSRIERRIGQKIPSAIRIQGFRAGPTPFAPVFGAYARETGPYYTPIGVPDDWSFAWSGL